MAEGPALDLPEEAVLGDTWTRPTDGKAMVYVPDGAFEMGSSDEEIDALYAHMRATFGR